MKNLEETAQILAQLLENAETDFEILSVNRLIEALTEPPEPIQLDADHEKFNGNIYKLKQDGHYGSHNGIHRDVWQYYKGEIPEGYVIHHKDFNPANNDISNLQLLTAREHKRLHAIYNGNFAQKREFICQNCGKKYVAIDIGKNKFCSEACSQKHYYRLKNPLVVKKCRVCGKEFLTTQTSRKKYCSKDCRLKANAKMHKHICEWCGREFESKSTEQKYCSNTCSMFAQWANEVRSK